jgi:protoheme IX farnesyltransferase
MIAIAKQIEAKVSLKAKLVDYHQLVKTRLTFSVVLSAVLGFLLAPAYRTDWNALLAVFSGGFLVVAAANGINQVIEKNYDKLMLRTNNRPVATGRMGVAEAMIFCFTAGSIGIFILARFLNPLSGWLGFIALVSYAFVYTPLKRVTPFAVLVGAIPGAIPPMLGWVAISNEIQAGAIFLFAIQFFWQFPHFWSIAWILDEDYRRAGYTLLPSRNGKDKKSAFFTIWYTFILIPLAIFPFMLGISGWVSMLVAMLAGCIMLFQAFRLYQSCLEKDAKKLMFLSIIYNPLILLAFLIDKM